MKIKNEVTYSLEQLKQAYARLREIIAAAGNDEYRQDGAIQRFEFTFELSWKTLKAYFSSVGKEISSPKEVLKEAFKDGIIKDEPVFRVMLEDRNLSSHVYDFATTRRIFDHIRDKYVDALGTLIQEIEKRKS